MRYSLQQARGVDLNTEVMDNVLRSTAVEQKVVTKARSEENTDLDAINCIGMVRPGEGMNFPIKELPDQAWEDHFTKEKLDTKSDATNPRRKLWRLHLKSRARSQV